MKRRHVFTLCLVAMMGLALMTATVQAQTMNVAPQKVETAVKVHKSSEWYKVQERLWKAEIEKNYIRLFDRK